MGVVETSVRRRISTIMLFIAILGAGVYGYSQLGLGLIPDVSFPIVSITTTMTGASPEEMENLVTKVIEQAASRVSGVQELSSSSMSGISQVSVEFDYGTDLEQAETDIRRNLEDYSSMLPDDADDPRVSVMDASSMPVVIVAFWSDRMSTSDLRNLIENDIDPILNRVEGVGSTSITGGLQREIKIEPDPAKLSTLGLTLGQIQQAISGRNYDQPAGEVVGDGMRTSITAEISYSSIDDIRQTVVGMFGEDPIYLSSVAEVVDGYEEVTARSRVNGSDVVSIQIYKRSSANSVSTCRHVAETLAEIQGEYGDALGFEIVMDESNFISSSISNLEQTCILAFVVAILVIFFFLRSWKNSFLIGISIPVSLVFTFFAMYLADVDLNIVSLAGLAIAVGMLVDNSIIVIESIHRHRIQGKNKVTAAVEGTKEVAGAITSSTLTTLAVFLPVLFVPGFSGQMFKDMALTVSFSLIISLLVAISLVPALSALFVKTESTVHMLEKVVAKASRIFRTTHRRILTFCLDHRGETIGATALLFACCLLLSGEIPKSLMPTMDQGNISISFGLVQGVDLATVDSVATVIEGRITSIIPEEQIESMMVSTGSSTGGMFLSSINEGTVRISLVGSNERDRSTFDYTFMLLNELGNMPGVDVEIMMYGMTSDDPAAVVLTGDDLDSLTVTAQRIKKMMDSVEGTSGVYTSIDQRIPELTFIPDLAKLSLTGITGPEVVAELRLGFMGSTVATFTEGGEEYEVFLRYPADHRADRVSLAYTPVLGYPLTSLGNLENISNPSSIDRENQTRIVTIATGTAPGYTSGQIGSAIEREMEKMDLPDGVTCRMGGEYGDQGSTFSYLMLAVLVAILLVYMVMAGQFESLKEPFIIILTVPMALIGVVTILFLSGTSLSIIALIGVLMLAGIAVNDGIVLVDYANQLQRKGMTVRSAIIQAAEVRARPIIMTTMTTVLAMIPVAVGIGQGSEMWGPLGIVVIGGLFSAMVLSLVVEPCLYVVTAGKSESLEDLESRPVT